MPENEKKSMCTGNCLNCISAQRAYCASQHAYSNMKVLDMMMQEVITIKEGMKGLSEKIEAIQSNEAAIFVPNAEKSESPINPIAQSGDGAEIDAPK